MDKRRKEGTDKAGDFVSKLIQLADEVNQSPTKRVHGTNEDMVVAQGSIFVLAGYETTASTMATLLFMLAKHPEAQQKVYEEIKENVSNSEEINYETVQHFKYMEAAIHENLRLHSPVTRNSRECTSAVTVNGQLVSFLQKDRPKDLRFRPSHPKRDERSCASLRIAQDEGVFWRGCRRI